MGRPCHVYDYEGEHLASFAEWDTAHGWAHLQAALNGAPTPIEVEDRRRRIGRRVWADRCEQLGEDEGFADADSFGLSATCVGVLAPPFAPPRPRMPS